MFSIKVKKLPQQCVEAFDYIKQYKNDYNHLVPSTLPKRQLQWSQQKQVGFQITERPISSDEAIARQLYLLLHPASDGIHNQLKKAIASLNEC